MREIKYHMVAAARGYTLVELLIGLFLGLVLVAMVIPAFITNIDSFKTVKSVARTHENARFALAELSRSIRTTGFRGCDSGQTDVQNLTGNSLYDFTIGLAGYERSGSETIAAITDSTIAVKAATDAITVRSLSLADGVLAADVPASSSTVTLSSGHSVQAGDVVFIGDCEQGYLFSASAVSSNTITFSNSVPANVTFDSGTVVYRFNTVTYFLAASQLYVNNAGNVPTSLWRKANTAAEEELVAGIENLQLIYGLDTDSDGAPNQFVNAATVAGNFNTVSIVRFKVLASSLDTLTDTTVLTKSFGMSVNLRNFSG